MSEALILAILLGIGLGFSLRRQARLREAVLESFPRSRAGLFYSLVQVGLSIAFIAAIILVGKEAQSVGYVGFGLTAYIAAILVLLYYFISRKHREIN